MPTQKPRITVTLPAPVFETIDRMAKLTKSSRGSVVAELIESVHPPLMRTVALLEAAADAPQQVQMALKETAESLEQELLQATEQTNLSLDQMLQSASGSANPTRGRSRARKANPRSSNTGVTSQKSKKKGKKNG